MMTNIKYNPEEWLNAILLAAYKFDDKPHLLFSQIRAAAIANNHLLSREEIYEVVRLMDLAYNSKFLLKLNKAMIKTYEKQTPPKAMLRKRRAIFVSEDVCRITFYVYGREGKKYTQRIEKDTLRCFCTCQAGGYARDCWHAIKAMRAYKLRIDRGLSE
jgi:SWIM zinc finger